MGWKSRWLPCSSLPGLDPAGSGAIVVLYRLRSFWFFLLGGCCAWITTTRVPDFVDAVEALTPLVAKQQSAIEDPK